MLPVTVVEKSCNLKLSSNATMSATCKLCFKDINLHKTNNVVLFEVHGATKKTAAKHVEM